MPNKDEKPQQPNDTTLSQARRSALKKILVGTSVAVGAAVVPSKWAKPIVNRVMVPAHAQTSPTTTTTTTTEAPLPTSFRGGVSLSIENDGEKTAKTGLIETLAGKILPMAHALPSSVEGELCITIKNDTDFEARLLISLAIPNETMASMAPYNGGTEKYYFEGSGKVGSTAADFPITVQGCYQLNIGPVQISVVGISADGADWAITGGLAGSALPLLPVKEGCPEKPDPCKPA
jgi:hypothetical protein